MSTRNHWFDWLKLFAALAMVADHLRFVFLDSSWLFVPGRIAFPLFAFVAVQNFRSSRRIPYMGRLLFFAIISEIPFHLLTGQTGNILFLFYFVFFSIELGFLSVATIFGVIGCDYGILGAIGVFLMWFRGSSFLIAFGGALMNPLPFGWISGMAAVFADRKISCVPAPSCVRWMAWFYPLHLCSLLLLKIALG